jgi:hypothetical protein
MFLPVSLPISRVLCCPPCLAIGLIVPVVLVIGQFPVLPLGFAYLLAFLAAAVFLVRMLCGYDKQPAAIFAFSPFHKDLLLTKSYKSLPETAYLFKQLREGDDCSSR